LNLHFLLSLPATSTLELVDVTSIPVVKVVSATSNSKQKKIMRKKLKHRKSMTEKKI
jgi:hypothetical protein